MPKHWKVGPGPRLTGHGGALTGTSPVAALVSPWWDHVASEMTSRPGLVGTTLSIEALTQMTPDYPNGTRPRPKTVARRLRRILHLVERGPNGARGTGALYLVVGLPVAPEVNPALETEVLQPDLTWLSDAAARMMTKRAPGAPRVSKKKPLKQVTAAKRPRKPRNIEEWRAARNTKPSK